jgi:hypothetical protein
LDSVILVWCGDFDVTVRYSRSPQEVFPKCLQSIRKSRALTLSPPLLRGGRGCVKKLRIENLKLRIENDNI